MVYLAKLADFLEGVPTRTDNLDAWFKGAYLRTDNLDAWVKGACLRTDNLDAWVKAAYLRTDYLVPWGERVFVQITPDIWSKKKRTRDIMMTTSSHQTTRSSKLIQNQ